MSFFKVRELIERTFWLKIHNTVSDGNAEMFERVVFWCRKHEFEMQVRGIVSSDKQREERCSVNNWMKGEAHGTKH